MSLTSILLLVLRWGMVAIAILENVSVQSDVVSLLFMIRGVIESVTRSSRGSSGFLQRDSRPDAKIV